MGGEDPAPVVRFVRLEDDRRPAVAEQDGHVPARVGVIQVVGLDLGGAEEDLLVCPGPDVLVGDREGVDEPAALVADVQGADRLVQAELGLDQDADAREIVVGREGRGDDEVDVVLVDPGRGDGLERGLDGEVRRVPRPSSA